MAVHVDELHSEVTPVGGPKSQGSSGDRRSSPWDADERWRAAKARAEHLSCRIAAEGFDD